MEDKISLILKENLDRLRADYSNSTDLTIREFKLNNDDKTAAAVVSIEGMTNKLMVTHQIMRPLTAEKLPKESPDKTYEYIKTEIISSPDILEITTYSELLSFSASGFAVLLIDGCGKMLAAGVQGFNFRSVSEPAGETVQRGSREGFSEPVRINMSLIRRRLKNPDLVFDTITVGEASQTQLCICYMKSVCDMQMVQQLKERIKTANLPSVLAAGYLVPFLEDEKDNSFFSGVGVSERPDTVCGKIAEGRIAVIVDGTPAVLLVPHLFVENFQTIDDYSNKAFFATFTRILKYTAFVVSLYLPGLYVALAYFHPEYFPAALLDKVVNSVFSTPLPLVFEVIMIFFIYEVMREAGLRIPRPAGHVVGIVGALVIGDAAVGAGIIGAPTLMVVAISSICGYVVPDLQATLTLQRLILIIAGATMGIFGITAVSVFFLINMCAKTTFGVPFMVPLAPFDKVSMRDVFVRQDWTQMGKLKAEIKNKRIVHENIK